MVRISVASLTCILLCNGAALGQQSPNLSIQTTTQERLDSEDWWPTKETVPLEAFSGSGSCTTCHSEESSGQISSMRRAAVVGAKATFLSATPSVTFNSRPLMYYLTATSKGIDYSVSNGARKLSHTLDWVMGAGELGRTFLYQADNRWYQSEVTFYTEHAALDTTTGLDPASPADLVTALGQPLSSEDAAHCFGCHTVHATSPAGLNPLHAEAGLGCEACHGPGLEHVTKMEAAVSEKPDAAHARPVSYAVFNPAKLLPVDSIDFCGACHRTFADATLSTGQSTSTAVVRFQPYRLEESKCWRATQDARLTCVACHNPHEPLNRDVASYDRHCLQCHSTVATQSAADHAAKVCPKATSQCVTCHMPKVRVASMHGDFTDHLIRVVHPGDSFPR